MDFRIKKCFLEDSSVLVFLEVILMLLSFGILLQTSKGNFGSHLDGPAHLF